MNDPKSSSKFKHLCGQLLTSTTEQAYNTAKERIDTFINAHEDRAVLNKWLSWWHERRGFLFRAFAPTNAPQMNQAEVIHASWVHRDSPNLSLLDACEADVRDSVVLDVELNEYEKDSLSVRTGPSYPSRKKREHVCEAQKAKQMGIDLLQDCRDGFLIDPNSARKPSTQKQQRKSKLKRKKKDSEHTINAENVPNTAPQMTFTSTGPQASNTFNNPFDTTVYNPPHEPTLFTSYCTITEPLSEKFVQFS